MNEEILEGLKSSVARGESLYQAMMSFYNAGYPKEEIESAARMMQSSFARNRITPEQKIQENPELQLKTIQKVSNYGEEKTQKEKITMMILFVLLFLMIGVLISIFIFRNKISEFLGSLV